MSREIADIAIFTALAAGAATLLMLPPGIGLAWLLARRHFPGKAVVETLVSLPLVVPPVATAVASSAAGSAAR